MAEARIRLININKVAGTPWSLSKSIRFPSSASKHKSEASYVPTSFASKSITMGFGKRWEPKSYLDSFSPTSNLYLPIGSLNSSVGPVFKYKPKRNDDNGVPGPGSYNPISVPRKSAQRVSLKSKFRDLAPVKCPSPISYTPKYSQVYKKNYKEVGFGFGDRNFLKNVETDSPGPNSYKIPSNFDKFKSQRRSALSEGEKGS